MSYRMTPPVGPIISILDALSIILNSFLKRDHQKNLEEFIRKEINCQNIWHFNNARSALYVGLKSIANLSPEKKEVLVPIYTCSTVLNSILKADLVPIPYDIDQANLGSSCKSIEDNINENTLAIIASGLYGIGIDIMKIKNVSSKKNIYLIEDISQNYLSDYINTRMGSVGDLAIISYGMSKPINAIGGGSLISNTIEMNTKINKLFDEQKKFSSMDFIKSCTRTLLLSIIIKPWVFKVVTIFYKKFSSSSNSKQGESKKMGAIQLSFINNELKKINATNNSRNENFAQLEKIIEKINGLETLNINSTSNHYLRLPVLCEKDRSSWIKKIRSCGLWASDELYEPTCKINSENVTSFPNYLKIKDRLILISIHPHINKATIQKLQSLI